MDIFSIFFNMKVCCVFSLESPHMAIYWVINLSFNWKEVMENLKSV